MEFKSNYSCNSAAETLEWINAIVNFLKSYEFFFRTNVVNFLKDRLWEALDDDWINCLKHEPVEYLLQIPSGIVQDYWPPSLKEYVHTAKLLAFPREPAKLEKVFPGISTTPLNSVLSQGMNPKKKHEVEVLSSVVSSITRNIGAHTVIDVGAGQGYLSLVLAFQHQLPVVAIDASSHHGVVTNIRAEKIKKHYAAKLHNSSKGLQNIPRTMTCRLLSSSMLRNLSNYCCQLDGVNKIHEGKGSDNIPARFELADVEALNVYDSDSESSLVLAGLHACGDLSVTMLRAFAECKEVKAVISIGCCYNLLSESGCENSYLNCGFPVSKGLGFMDFRLGKNACDLACQSAERWRSLEKDAGIQNFDLHGFRAVFQMVLDRYYPEVLITSPSIGRQGKTLRHQHRKTFIANSSDPAKDNISQTAVDMDSSTVGFQCNFSDKSRNLVDKCTLFKKFSHSGLHHLRIKPLQDIDLNGVWRECQPSVELIGPYWSLRAALGPVLETLILLDRLLFLQEQESVEVFMLPIFDPVLSPRNLAIIAQKISTTEDFLPSMNL